MVIMIMMKIVMMLVKMGNVDGDNDNHDFWPVFAQHLTVLIKMKKIMDGDDDDNDDKT